MTKNKILTEVEIKKRFPVWDSMSDLFLDTELDENSYRSIASVIVDSQYSAEEIHDIFWFEVFPGVGDNLRCIAGEWAGFNNQWLQDRITSVIAGEATYFSAHGFISVNSLVRMTKKEWKKVCSHLPDHYRDFLMEKSKSYHFNQDSITKPWWKFW